MKLSDDDQKYIGKFIATVCSQIFHAIGCEHMWNVDKVRTEIHTQFARQYLCLNDIDASFVKCKAFSLFISHIVRGHCNVKMITVRGNNT